MTENEQSKRDFLKKTAYVVPCILTLKAIPSFAGTGSGEAKTAESYSGKDKKGNNGVGDDWDEKPHGNSGKKEKEDDGWDSKPHGNSGKKEKEDDGWDSKPHGNPGKKEKENDERRGNKHQS